MRLLQRYVANSFLTAFILGMLVLTFVLSVGLLVKAVELMVRGLPARLILNFLMVSMPQSFTFTVPVATLASALLVFGRLSSDGEISAMKACGINIWSVMVPVVWIGLLMSFLSIYINHQISPQSYFARRSLSALAKSDAGLTLLQPGHFIQEFPGMTFWFERREGNRLHNLLIFDRSKANLNREIRAERADVEVRDDDIYLDMYNVRIEPVAENQPGAVTAERLTHVIQDAMQERIYKPTVAAFNFAELRQSMIELESEADELARDTEILPAERQLALDDLAKRLSMARTEYQRRFALGFAPLIFVLIGMPLGIRNHRRETNIGIITSIAVMVVYYSFLIVTKTLAKRPEFHTDILIWLPTIACAVMATLLIRRNR